MTCTTAKEENRRHFYLFNVLLWQERKAAAFPEVTLSSDEENRFLENYPMRLFSWQSDTTGIWTIGPTKSVK